MTSTEQTEAPPPTVSPPVKLRIVCDGRPWALRVETEDGRLVDNVAHIRIEWGGDDPVAREGQPVVTLTIVNIPIDLQKVYPNYVRIELADVDPPRWTPVERHV